MSKYDNHLGATGPMSAMCRRWVSVAQTDQRRMGPTMPHATHGNDAALSEASANFAGTLRAPWMPKKARPHERRPPPTGARPR